ncbi:hypothetical protein TNCV_3429211 [Trichonephila clavipes]|nr:hypothetical protein TNCV_3429211 [Trichonephila clavipes]
MVTTARNGTCDRAMFTGFLKEEWPKENVTVNPYQTDLWILQRHRRSGYLLSSGSNLYPPPSKSLFFRAPLKLSPSRALNSSPKKTLLNTRGGSTTRPSSLLVGRPQKSPLVPGPH